MKTATMTSTGLWYPSGIVKDEHKKSQQYSCVPVTAHRVKMVADSPPDVFISYASEKYGTFPQNQILKIKIKQALCTPCLHIVDGFVRDTHTKHRHQTESVPNFVHGRFKCRGERRQVHVARGRGSTTESVRTIWGRGKSRTPEGHRTKNFPSTNTYSG